MFPSALKRKHDSEENYESVNKKQLLDSSDISSTDQTTDRYDPEEDEPIKLYSSDQRLAEGEEPICIICGKYGEYINNDTDDDVCSMECKQLNTDMKPYRVKKKPVIIHHIHDYVADNLHSKLTNYQEPPSIANMSSELRTNMLKAFNIQVKGSHVPNPFSTYDELSSILGDTLLSNIESMGWSMATGIQRQAVTAGLAGRDIMGIAATHSGKTGAYLIPVIVHCMSISNHHSLKRRAGPYALIMAPTRELCIQIESICKKLSQGIRNMRTGLLIGGQPLPTQIFRLKTGVQIIIGTPGRIVETVTHHPKLFKIWNIHMIVVDEVDAMFSLGFETQIRQILGKLPDNVNRQTMYFSATLNQNKQMETMIRKMKKPIEILVDQAERMISNCPEPSDQVRQTILWVENKSKAKRLFSILQDPKYFVVPILVFVDSRLGSEFLTRAIKRRNPQLRVVSMHGDKTQEERSMIVSGINQVEPLWDVIVSTDILSRGIDLPNVRLVINYDMASTLEDYVHRIGRAVLQKPLPSNTKQQRGWAITFINEEHKHLLEPLALMLARKSPAQVTPLPIQLRNLL
ncbi:P-loop containing nucleoside triphosphate hydrolase protein [Pilobolus umbonatus]|nr:P-loop containing nucleoside triphosphate hydrolase protein [Pilobolus umbonatus]